MLLPSCQTLAKMRLCRKAISKAAVATLLAIFGCTAYIRKRQKNYDDMLCIAVLLEFSKLFHRLFYILPFSVVQMRNCRTWLLIRGGDKKFIIKEAAHRKKIVYKNQQR